MDETDQERESLRQTKRIYWASGLVSTAGIIFEVLFGAVGSYILGDGVKQYSLIIGLFLTGMGVGASLSERVMQQFMLRFVQIEFAIAVIGGFSTLSLFGVMAFIGSGVEALLLYSVAFLVGGLSGLELPILIRKAAEIGVALHRSTARVLFSDYAGSLLGSLLFVLLLRPMLGLVKTAFVVACINLFVGLWILYTFRKEMKRPRPHAAVGLLLLLIMGSGVAWGDAAAFTFEQRLYTSHMVDAFDTAYQRVVVTREADDTRLYLDGNLQLSSVDEYRYHEALVHIPMLLSTHRENVLILGGGDGMAAREVLKYPEAKRITLVDLDEQLVNYIRGQPLFTAMNQGALEDPRVKLVYEDAYQFLMEEDRLYDLILVDLPDPNNDDLNKLYTQQFYQLIMKRLAPEGIVSLQATSPLYAREVYWTIDHTVEAAGLQTENYHVDIPSFGDWGFVLASLTPLSAAQRLQDPEIEVSTRYLNERVIPGLFRFGKDEDRNILDEQGNPYRYEVNSMQHPVLIPLYEKAWRYY